MYWRRPKHLLGLACILVAINLDDAGSARAQPNEEIATEEPMLPSFDHADLAQLETQLTKLLAQVEADIDKIKEALTFDGSEFHQQMLGKLEILRRDLVGRLANMRSIMNAPHGDDASEEPEGATDGS